MTKFYEMTTVSNNSVILNPDHFVEVRVIPGESVTVIMTSGHSHTIAMESFVQMVKEAKLEMFLYAPQQASEVNFEDLPDHDIEDLVEGA